MLISHISFLVHTKDGSWVGSGSDLGITYGFFLDALVVFSHNLKTCMFRPTGDSDFSPGLQSGDAL